MTAHIRVPLLTGRWPATFSHAVLTGLLRDEYGFTGTVITDALEMKGASLIAGGSGQGAVHALAAGADLLCVGADVDAALVEEIAAEIVAAVSAGRLSLARVEQAAERTAALAAWTAARTAAGHGPDQATTAAAPVTVVRIVVDPDNPAGAVDATDSAASTPLPVPDGLGYTAARAAVRVHGAIGTLTDPLVVQLFSASTMAEGRVPWGLGPHLNGVEQIRLVAAETDAQTLRELAGSRPIVLVGRHLHRLPGGRELVESLAGSHPVTVVEMGWPSSWRPADATAFVVTYGASHANGRAAAEVLGLAG